MRRFWKMNFTNKLPIGCRLPNCRRKCRRERSVYSLPRKQLNWSQRQFMDHWGKISDRKTIKVGLPRIRCGKMVDPVVGFRIRRDCCCRDGTFFRMFWQISHRQTWCAAPSILPTEPVVWKKIFCADVHCAPILFYPSQGPQPLLW